MNNKYKAQEKLQPD